MCISLVLHLLTPSSSLLTPSAHFIYKGITTERKRETTQRAITLTLNQEPSVKKPRGRGEKGENERVGKGVRECEIAAEAKEVTLVH